MNAHQPADAGEAESSPLPDPTWAISLVALLGGTLGYLWRHERGAAGAHGPGSEAILASLAAAVVATDLDGRVTYLTPAAENLFGYRAAELVGQSSTALVPPDRRPEWAEACARVLRGEPVPPVETVRLGRDGQCLAVVIKLTPTRGAAGTVVGATALYHDLRLRGLASPELQRERDFLRAVLENITEGVVACDADGVLTFFNRAARQLHGRDLLPLPPPRWAEHYRLCRPDGRTPLRTEEIPLYRALHG